MKLSVLALLAVGVCLSAPVLGDDKDEDHEKLVGSWKLVAAEHNGRELAKNDIPDVTLIHEEEKDGKHTFMVKSGGKVTARGTFKHGEPQAGKHHTYDAQYTEGESKGKTVLGIYELKGDTLKLAWDGPGKERPKEFKTKAGTDLVVRTYQRQK